MHLFLPFKKNLPISKRWVYCLQKSLHSTDLCSQIKCINSIRFMFSRWLFGCRKIKSRDPKQWDHKLVPRVARCYRILSGRETILMAWFMGRTRWDLMQLRLRCRRGINQSKQLLKRLKANQRQCRSWISWWKIWHSIIINSLRRRSWGQVMIRSIRCRCRTLIMWCRSRLRCLRFRLRDYQS